MRPSFSARFTIPNPKPLGRPDHSQGSVSLVDQINDELYSLMDQSTNITLEFRNCDALVLYDWLSSLDPQGHRNKPDDATQKLLLQIEGILEKHLPEVLDPSYKQLLFAAKNQVLGFGTSE